MSIDSKVTAPKQLYRNDPLLWFLLDELKLKNYTIVIAITLISFLVQLFGGIIISFNFYRDSNIIRVNEPGYYIIAVFGVFFVIPIIWLLYTWQPNGITKTIDDLIKEEVMDIKNGEWESIFNSLRHHVDNRWLPIISVTIIIIFILIQTFIVIPEMEQNYWWFIDKGFYYLLGVPVISLTYYAGTMLAIKGIMALWWFKRIFNKVPVVVHPLHPDNAGGFGALGSFAVIYGSIGILLGMLGAIGTIARGYFGGGYIHEDTILLYFLYIVITPVALILPLWGAHNAMVKYRYQMLNEISKEFEELLLKDLQRLPERFPKSKKNLITLDEGYRLISDTYPVWPISLNLLRRFSITALLPIFTSVSTILLDKLIS